MTVSSIVRKAGPFAGNNLATTFPFSFKVFEKGDVKVLRVSPSGVSTQLVLDSDYSVQLNADQDNQPGGWIVYPISGDPLPTGYNLVGLGSLPYDQQTDITNQGGFYPQTVEDMSDRSTIQIQQLAEISSRAIVLSEAESTSPTLPSAQARVNTVLGFDAAGNLELYPVTPAVGAGDLKNEVWASGVDFTEGISTSVPLSRKYGTKANLGTVVMQGLAQDPDTYMLSADGLNLVFDAPIPVGVGKIYCIGGTTLSNYMPPAGSVTDETIAEGSTLSNRMNDLPSITDYGCAQNSDNAAKLLQAAGEHAYLYVPAGSWPINTNCTLNATFEFADGAQFVIADGVTVTFSRDIRAGLYQIFSGNGVPVFGSRVRQAQVEWFGAGITGGGFDDMAAVQKCLNACAANVRPMRGSSNIYARSTLTMNSFVPITWALGKTITGDGTVTVCVKFGQFNALAAIFLPNITNFKADSNSVGLAFTGTAFLRVYIGSIDNCYTAIKFNTSASAGPTTLDNTVIGEVISVCTNGVLMTGDNTANVLQGNRVQFNFSTSVVNTVLYQASVQPNWDSNYFEFEAIDPNNVAGARALRNLTGVVARCTFKCNSWLGGFPADGVFVDGNFSGLDFSAKFNDPISAYSRWNVTGSNNHAKFFYDQPNTSPISAATAGGSVGTFNGGVPVNSNRMFIQYTLPASVANGATSICYVYHPLMSDSSDKIKYTPVSVAGMMLDQFNGGTNTREIQMVFRNVGGSTLAAGTTISFFVEVG